MVATVTCQYAAHCGSIGTAVSTHSTLPLTGLSLVTLGLVAAILVLCGITIRLGGRAHGDR